MPGPAGPASWLRLRRDDRGFTLIEVVAIMAILGLMLAVVLPSIPQAVSRPQIEAVALAAAAILDGDHRSAVRRHIPVSAVVDAGRRLVGSGAGGRSLTLPAGVAITTTLARTCLGAPVRDRIVFLPDGTSCGGAIALDRAGQRVDIRVNWLTGVAEVAPHAP